MSSEALARALHSNTYPWCRQPDTECHCGEQAERILADPAPLLAALAEAGVLKIETRTAMVWRGTGEPGWDCVDDADRHYVTEWTTEETK